MTLSCNLLQKSPEIEALRTIGTAPLQVELPTAVWRPTQSIDPRFPGSFSVSGHFPNDPCLNTDDRDSENQIQRLKWLVGKSFHESPSAKRHAFL